MIYKYLNKVKKNRMNIFMFFIGLLFFILIIRLYLLQIVHGKEYAIKFDDSITKKLRIKSERGAIYDRFGRPIATNKIVFNLKYDSSSKNKEINETLLEIIDLLDRKGQKVVSNLPISMQKPYTYITSTKTKELRWKKDHNIKPETTAYNLLKMYAEDFDIGEDFESIRKRKLLDLRFAINENRYKKYKPINIALNIPRDIVTIIEENNDIYTGVFIEEEPIRIYPYKETLSHLLGYTGKVNSTDLKNLEGNNYTEFDIVGKTGIEQAMELQLRGKDGEVYVEVDKFGRRLETTNVKESQKGNDIILTIDAKLQKRSEEILIDKLTEILIGRIYSKKASDKINLRDIYEALLRNNIVDSQVILEGDGVYQHRIRNRLLDYDKNDNKSSISSKLEKMYKSYKISNTEVLMLLIEQGKISVTSSELRNIKSGRINHLTFIVNKMREKEITPQDLAFNPSTGAVVVEDVNTGEILSLVNYPSYDNNKLSNTFDYEYYKKLLNDPTYPLINRALSQRKAPGSTFKMISAIAGLEEGVIDEYEIIKDEGEYKKAGRPYAKCWIYNARNGYRTHGNVDVRKALEVSCNYFFYEMSHRLKLSKDKTKQIALKGISKLNKYAKMFGLNEKSGIELINSESFPQISSPENKEKAILRYKKDATERQTKWYSGDLIRSAIGQGWNNYAPIHMAKYISTIANDGNRYNSYIVKEIKNNEEERSYIKKPMLKEKLPINPKNLKIVQEGMLRVTRGREGSTRKYFGNFPIKVAGKTGTAQETNKPSNAWFVSYAPFDKPQIAVVVMLPYGYSSSNAVTVGRDIIAEYFKIDNKDSLIEKDNILVR